MLRLASLLVFALLCSGCASSGDVTKVLEMMQQNCHTKGHVEGNASLTGAQGSNSFDFECWPTQVKQPTP